MMIVNLSTVDSSGNCISESKKASARLMRCGSCSRQMGMDARSRQPFPCTTQQGKSPQCGGGAAQFARVESFVALKPVEATVIWGVDEQGGKNENQVLDTSAPEPSQQDCEKKKVPSTTPKMSGQLVNSLAWAPC